MNKLVCPDFHQYVFYSAERLKNILDCVRIAPVLVIDPSFHRYEQPPNWLPIGADKQRIIDTWNHFVSAGEGMVRTHFSCKRFNQIRICSANAL
jgi:predicted FMN-binding regulatory protein PaiB